MIAEVAFSFVLMAGAGLMIRSFAHLVHVDPGFDANNLLELTLPGKKYSTPAQGESFFDQLKQNVARLPGVMDVTVASGVPPISASFEFGIEVEVEGGGVEKLAPEVNLPFYEVDSDYFRVLRIPLLKGRGFSAQDTRNSPRVTIINDEMARRFWPGKDPIGRRLRLGSDRPWLTVVGIAADVKALGLRDQTGSMEMYYPSTQAPLSQGILAARTSGDPIRYVDMIKHQVWALDKNQPIVEIGSGAQQMDKALAEERFYLLLMTCFAGTSILLAVTGIYRVISCLVAQRTHEVGIRMALGACAADVLRLVVRRGAMLIVAGLALGLAGALAVTRLLSTLLFEVSPIDPATFVAVSLLMVAMALLACLVPARRAIKVDPNIALRCE